MKIAIDVDKVKIAIKVVNLHVASKECYNHQNEFWSIDRDHGNCVIHVEGEINKSFST